MLKLDYMTHWLTLSKQVILKNDYPQHKIFMNNIHVVQEATLTVEKKSLVLVLPYLVYHP